MTFTYTIHYTIFWYKMCKAVMKRPYGQSAAKEGMHVIAFKNTSPYPPDKERA